MKILHVNTLPHGGAFNGAYRLHTALLKAGLPSKMLVRDKFDNPALKQVFTIDQKPKSVNLLTRLLYKLGYPQTAYLKRMKLLNGRKGSYEIISFPFSDFDITKTKEYKEADIIHIHWVADFLNYESFFTKNTKPLVITLRDLFPIQGIFHYKEDVTHNQNVLAAIEAKMKKYKMKAFWNSPVKKIKIVGISNWITEESLKSEIHKDFEHETIFNCIDVDKYTLLDKNSLRDSFNIQQRCIVFTFISDGAVNRRKGMGLLAEAVSKLEDTKNIQILTAGHGVPPVLPVNIVHRHFGHLDQSTLNKLFSISDAFIFPTREEALGNVMLEAMACGVPVIGTPVGGLLDVIKPGFNGIFSYDISAEALKIAIEEFIATRDSFNSSEIRSYISEKFSEEKISSQYIDVYKSLCGSDVLKDRTES